MSAAISCKRLTVGSSPKTSSPTSAFAMASRISGVGLVTVSERRSMNSIFSFPFANYPARVVTPAAMRPQIAVRVFRSARQSSIGMHGENDDQLGWTISFFRKLHRRQSGILKTHNANEFDVSDRSTDETQAECDSEKTQRFCIR